MTATQKHIHRVLHGGYTLVEMLVIVAVLGIIIPALFSTISNLYDSHASTLSRALALVDTTNALQEVVRDIRSAVSSENGSIPLDTIEANNIILYSDTDFDGRVERMRYYLSGTTLMKGTIEPTASSTYPAGTEVHTTLAEGIRNADTATPVFRYFTATSTEITSPDYMLEVRRVEVTLIGSSRFGGETSEVELRSSATIRNLKTLY